ncbi:hypothetical protein ACHAPF_004884 [Botrytis cinerea]
MFFYPPLRWSNEDIENQKSQQASTQRFQDPSSQMHHSTDHSREQNSSHNDSIENRDTPSSHAIEDHDIQDPNTQSLTQNPTQSLTNTPTRRPLSTSNPEFQFSIPRSVAQENNNPKSHSENKYSFFIPPKRHEDRKIDLESQYPSIQASGDHPNHYLETSFANRDCKASGSRGQRSISDLFEHHVNRSQCLYSNTQDAHQNANSEPTFTPTQRMRGKRDPEHGFPRVELLFHSSDHKIDDVESQRFKAPEAHAHPIELDFSKVIQTLRRPIDYFRRNVEGTKTIWQCVPNQDLEEGMLGCYAWNHEDKDVCVSCRRERVKGERSRLVALKSALDFGG